MRASTNSAERCRRGTVGAIARTLSLIAALQGCRDERPWAAEIRAGDAALAEGRFARALAAYTLARELAPTDPDEQLAQMRARAHLAAEQPSRISLEAVESIRCELDLLLEKDKAHAAAYLTALANVHLRAGDEEAARAKLGEALVADPGSYLAHTALGLMHLDRRAPVEARVELEAALRGKANHPTALVALARLDSETGDIDEAGRKLEAALRVVDDFAARMALGALRGRQEQHLAAAEQFHRASLLDPKSADALSACGQALLHGGKLEEAEQVLRAAAELRADDATLVPLGLVLARRNRFPEALAAAERVLTHDGRHPTALFTAGLASEGLGRKPEALDFYKRMLALPAPEGPHRESLLQMHTDAQSRLLRLATSTTAAPSTSGRDALVGRP